MIANPIPWPGGARCACTITFDMDADSLIHIARPKDGHDRHYPITMGRYGPTVAIPAFSRPIASSAGSSPSSSPPGASNSIRRPSMRSSTTAMRSATTA
jgi:hypothetical protein